MTKDFRNIKNGVLIPSYDYADQPEIIIAKDGTMICAVTTAKGDEGASGTFVGISRSYDGGKSWSELERIDDCPYESSYSTLIMTDYGRIYCFYDLNDEGFTNDDIFTEPDGTRAKVWRYDMGYGIFCFKYSDDNGETWRYVSELFPCFWGKMFIHKEKLYMLACSTEYGDLLIGCSEDGGKTFGAPSVLLRGTARGTAAGIHKNPQNIVKYNGRIYETLEWGQWAQGYHAPMIMSCNEDVDLLNPENWHFTPPVKYDSNWDGVAKGQSSGNIEGTLVIFPDGKLYNIMRYDMSRTTPNFGLVIAYKVNTDNPDAPLEYSHSIEFPANHSKFMIKKDNITNTYYTIASRILSANHANCRNLLSLMKSNDMKKWDLVCDLIDKRDENPNYIGFQYVDFEIENADIIALIRIGMNNPHNFHDSNYSTFYRIKNFRELPQPCSAK